MNRQEKIDVLYMYTCKGIGVIPRDKDRTEDGIEGYVGVSSSTIYNYLRSTGLDTSHKGGNSNAKGVDCGCFMIGKYRKVKGWMIEEYVDNGEGQDIKIFMDNLLRNKANRVRKNITTKNSSQDMAYINNQPIYEPEESIGPVLFMILLTSGGGYLAFTKMDSWFRWPIVIFCGLAVIGGIVEIIDNIRNR